MKKQPNILSNFFSLSDNFLAIINLDGYIQEYNSVWEKELLYPKEEIISKPIWEFSDDNSLETFFKKQNFQNQKLEVVFLDKENHSHLLEWKFTLNEQENIIFALGKEVFSTRNLQVEQQNILQSIPVGIVKVNLQGEITYANSEASKILELGLDKITHKFYNNRQWNQIDLEGNPFPLDELPIALAMQHKKVVRNIQHGIIANQIIKWLSVNASPFYDKNKEMVGVIASFQDITQNIKNDIVLRQSYKELENFKYALDESAMVSITDTNGNFTYVNSAFCEISKYRREELIGKSYHILNSGFHEAGFFAEMWEVVNEGKPWRAEVKKRARDGTFFWVEAIVTPLFDEKGKVHHYLRINHDITQSKLTEQKLQEREEMMESIHNNMKDGIYRSSSKKGLIYISPGFVKLFGYKSEDEIYNMNPNVLYENIEQRNLLQEEIGNQIINSQINEVEANFRRKDGSCFIGLITFRLVKATEDEVIYDGIIKDITNRKQVEQENAKLALVAQETDNLVIITDTKGYIEWVNDGFIKKMELSWEEVIGKKTADIFVDEPRDLEARQKMIRAIEKYQNTQVEMSVLSKSGQKVFLQINLQPIFDINGNVQNFIAILSDISSLKNKTEELENLSNELIRRNEGLEQFNYIISHNVRSQVANIIGLMEIYDKKNPMNEFNQTIINHLEESAEKLDVVIKDLNDILELRHHLNEKKQKIYFMDLYIEIVRSIEHQIEKAQTSIDVDFRETPSIFTVKSYLQSILFNLISNAIKYKALDRKNIIKISTQSNDKYITLVVEDNGVGIDLSKNKEKIFGLYQKLHTHTEGKGMGLFILKTQVEALEGKIEVESKLDYGTKFIIHFKK